jgi:hypothetical protein
MSGKNGDWNLDSTFNVLDGESRIPIYDPTTLAAHHPYHADHVCHFVSWSNQRLTRLFAAESQTANIGGHNCVKPYENLPVQK